MVWKILESGKNALSTLSQILYDQDTILECKSSITLKSRQTQSINQSLSTYVKRLFVVHVIETDHTDSAHKANDGCTVRYEYLE